MCLRWRCCVNGVDARVHASAPKFQKSELLMLDMKVEYIVCVVLEIVSIPAKLLLPFEYSERGVDA